MQSWGCNMPFIFLTSWPEEGEGGEEEEVVVTIYSIWLLSFSSCWNISNILSTHKKTAILFRAELWSGWPWTFSKDARGPYFLVSRPWETIPWGAICDDADNRDGEWH